MAEGKKKKHLLYVANSLDETMALLQQYKATPEHFNDVLIEIQRHRDKQGEDGFINVSAGYDGSADLMAIALDGTDNVERFKDRLLVVQVRSKPAEEADDETMYSAVAFTFNADNHIEDTVRMVSFKQWGNNE